MNFQLLSLWAAHIQVSKNTAKFWLLKSLHFFFSVRTGKVCSHRVEFPETERFNSLKKTLPAELPCLPCQWTARCLQGLLSSPHEKWISKAMSRPKMGWLWGEAARNMRCCRNALGSRGERLRLCWEVFARTVQAENVERLRWVRQAMRVCQHHFASTGCLPLPSAPAASSLPLYILPETRQEEPCPSLPPKTDGWCLPWTDFTVLR